MDHDQACTSGLAQRSIVTHMKKKETCISTMVLLHQYSTLVYDGNVNIFSVCHSRQVNVATWILVLPIDIANPYRLSSVTYIYIYIKRHIYFWHHILAISPAVCQNGSQMFIEIYRVGDNRRIVNTSTTPHIWDQLGTENACKTLFC